jgi:hypothetical protein
MTKKRSLVLLQVLAVAVMVLLDGCDWLNPPDSLVAYYPFSGNANDESGNGYNGIVYGASPAMDRFGVPDSAYSFDGIDDRILTTQEHFRSGNELSVALWVNATPGQGLEYFLMCSDFGVW